MSNEGLRELHIRGNEFTDNAAERLAQSIQANSGLTAVTFKSKLLTNVGTTQLTTAIKRPAKPSSQDIKRMVEKLYTPAIQQQQQQQQQQAKATPAPAAVEIDFALREFLSGLGLQGECEMPLLQQGVDFDLLASLSSDEIHALLKEAGIKPGHRFKIVKAIEAQHKKKDEL